MTRNTKSRFPHLAVGVSFDNNFYPDDAGVDADWNLEKDYQWCPIDEVPDVSYDNREWSTLVSDFEASQDDFEEFINDEFNPVYMFMDYSPADVLMSILLDGVFEEDYSIVRREGTSKDASNIYKRETFCEHKKVGTLNGMIQKICEMTRPGWGVNDHSWYRKSAACGYHGRKRAAKREYHKNIPVFGV